VGETFRAPCADQTSSQTAFSRATSKVRRSAPVADFVPMEAMKRIIVTPAGRRKYLSILAAHLSAQKPDFDEWHLWVNTIQPEDIAFMRGLAEDCPWIQLRFLGPDEPYAKNLSIRYFYKYATRSDATYLRLDDDIVFLEPGFCKAVFQLRESDRKHLLVFPSIVNNACHSFIRHARGALTIQGIWVSSYCMDEVMWRNSEFAAKQHEIFLECCRTSNFDPFRFPPMLAGPTRISVNACAWRGDVMNSLASHIDVADEESWLTEYLPARLAAPNLLAGTPVCAHFAFFPQEETLLGTNFLERFRNFAPAPPQLSRDWEGQELTTQFESWSTSSRER
jgi:hypothetical protein